MTIVRSLLIQAVTLCAMAIGGANASLIVTAGNVPGGTDNVLANACDASASLPGPALIVLGCLNTNHAQKVILTSEEMITYTGGQATVDDDDGNGFNSLKIELEGLTFTKLILNIDGLGKKGDLETVTFTDNFANTSGPLNLTPNGQNFFTITGGPFSYIQFTTTYNVSVSADAVDDVKQIRIGGPAIRESPDTSIPEPTTVALLALGLLGISVVRRQSR